MHNKLTAKEIVKAHGISERQAYRWLAEGDPRTFAPEESPAQKRDYEQRQAAERLRVAGKPPGELLNDKLVSLDWAQAHARLWIEVKAPQFNELIPALLQAADATHAAFEEARKRGFIPPIEDDEEDECTQP